MRVSFVQSNARARDACENDEQARVQLSRSLSYPNSLTTHWACGLAVMTTPLQSFKFGVGHQFEMSSLRDSQAENLVRPILFNMRQ